jgi:hypothetical protein
MKVVTRRQATLFLCFAAAGYFLLPHQFIPPRVASAPPKWHCDGVYVVPGNLSVTGTEDLGIACSKDSEDVFGRR